MQAPLPKPDSVPRSHPPAPACRHHRGFSLTEVLVALAIVAVLAALALPGMRHLVRDYQVRVVAQDLLAWMRDPRAPLPSGADAVGAAWLAQAEP